MAESLVSQFEDLMSSQYASIYAEDLSSRLSSDVARESRAEVHVESERPVLSFSPLPPDRLNLQSYLSRFRARKGVNGGKAKNPEVDGEYIRRGFIAPVKSGSSVLTHWQAVSPERKRKVPYREETLRALFSEK